MRKIAYYITAHGYGHGTRSFDIINALCAAEPDIAVVIKTDLPHRFIQSRTQGVNIEVVPGAFDVGLIQRDSIRIDLEASLRACEALYANEAALVEQEINFIHRENVGVVVADIPAIPLAAAQRAGIPNIAVGNFGWDWIYADFARHDPQWQIFADAFRTVYEQTDLLLRLPFSEPMAAFPHPIDLPLLSRPGTDRRATLAKKTGADPAKKWVLLSFTSLNLDAPALATVGQLDEYEFFSAEPLAWPGTGIHCIRRSTASFADILASIDVVVTKPGFGIVSESIANERPIIYTERDHFREYEVLVESIETYCRNVFIPGRELYAGDLSRALKCVQETAPPPLDMPRGGAELAAQQILRKLP